MQIKYSTCFKDWELFNRICSIENNKGKDIYFTSGPRWLGTKQPDILFISKKETKNKS